MNLRKIGRNVLLAICDAEILGKTFRRGRVVFSVKKEFYGDVKTSIEEAVAMIESSTIVNIVGKNVVRKAVEKGYVHPEAVLTIQGVPHAQIVKV